MNPNDSTAKYYDKVYTPIKGSDVVDEEIELIKSLIPAQSKIIDVGCGTGRHLIPLVEEGFYVTGVDSSAGMLEELRSKLTVDRSRFTEILNTDIFNCKLQTVNYQLAILMWNSFNEIALNEKDALNLLQKLKAALTPNGKILINIDNPEIIDFKNIDHTIVSKDGDYKYESEFKVLDFDSEGNILTSEETVSKFDKDGNLLESSSTSIIQKYWKISEVEQITKKFGFSFEIKKVESNEELYIVISLKK